MIARRPVFAVVLALFALAAAVPAPAQEKVSREIELGRTFSDQFFKGELSKVYAHFSSGLREEFTLDSFRTFRAKADAQLGVETEKLDERVEVRDEYNVYIRRSRYAKRSEQVLLTWWLKADGTIGAFKFEPVTVPTASR